MRVNTASFFVGNLPVEYARLAYKRKSCLFEYCRIITSMSKDACGLARKFSKILFVLEELPLFC